MGPIPVSDNHASRVQTSTKQIVRVYIKLQGSLLTGMCRVYIYIHTHAHLPAMKTNIAMVLNWYYLKSLPGTIRVQGWYCLMSYWSGRLFDIRISTSLYTNVSTLCPPTHRPRVHHTSVGWFLEYEEWMMNTLVEISFSNALWQE